MFGQRIKIFTLLGFEVRADLSWIVLAVLVTWSLARGVFPDYFENLPERTYWFMGAAGALGLFLSIIFHELSHSLIARKFGIPMKGITLFIFGGVAEMTEEAPDAKAEFWMALVGPASSLFLSAIFFVISRYGEGAGWSLPVVGVLFYLAWINVALAVFNLIPAFPLDGGRLLRAVLWGARENIQWATRVTSRLGSGFGILLIALGLYSVIQGQFIGGIWWFLIGMFVRSAAQTSYQQLLTRKALEGERVSRFMVTDPVTVPPGISLQQLVDHYIYRHHFKMYPIVEEGRLLGYVTVRQLKEVPHDRWDRVTVGEVAMPLLPEMTIPSDTDALRALSVMNRTGSSRLMVVEGDRLVGIIALKDLLQFLSLKLSLEETKQPAARSRDVP
ncbi:MAG TPA: site-2 protease family protein [Syntrophales bacterium]|nr:site-2 protease family protein [Syntrophales bacterium]HOX93719.1 site-2 protease family protein [Syntrophales bacterium]HPI57064.1 site-2 protease family protein [Syntrophales bacterium]HPN23806.1 site-2 protease family protein [Syntrophales bacterium]HQM30123.1 site-2 protease family protein [Syntrophales bacterium]